MEKINKSQKSEKSPKRLTSPNIAAKKSKFSPTKRKRNSMAFQPNEFSKFQKKMYGEQNSSPRKEDRKRSLFMDMKSSAKKLVKKDIKIKDEKIEISNKKSVSPSPSPSLSSSSSSLSSNSSSEKSKDKKKISKKKFSFKDTDYKQFKIQAKKSSKNNTHKKSNKNVIINESEIQSIKEEYGNKARLMSVDYMAYKNKEKTSNKDLFKMNNEYNNIFQVSERQELPFKTLQNFDSKSFRNNLSITRLNNNNNFMINSHFNKRVSYNLDSNKIKSYQYKNINNINTISNISNTIFPPLSLKSDR